MSSRLFDLVKQRRYVILILFILAELITPRDSFSCLLVFIPLYVSFEILVTMVKTKRDKSNDQ
jgi:Sec-independent protein secretion pathway component TatC